MSSIDRGRLRLPPTDSAECDYIRRFERALSELPKKQREIFRMSAAEDLTYLEIADRLGLKVSVVSRHLTKALRYLDDQMRP